MDFTGLPTIDPNGAELAMSDLVAELVVGDDDRVGIFGRLETQSKSTEAASWDGAEGGSGTTTITN